MGSNYQKFEIKMKRKTHDFNLRHQDPGEPVCILETYKEKRSVYFSAANLLPPGMQRQKTLSQYYILLLGGDNGEILHQTLGPAAVSTKGQCTLFAKFGGPPLSCYTHCLLIAEWEDGDADVVYEGETPFLIKEQKAHDFTAALEWCSGQVPSKVFSADVDELKACWYKVPYHPTLPLALLECRTQIDTYGHYLIGRKEDLCYVGVPGRFLQCEQPCRAKALFLLWQPLAGGETFFRRREDMTREEAEKIFGYWIAEVDLSSGTLKSV